MNEHQRPEGRLIEVAQKRARISARKAADAAGMSDARWRQIVNGYQSAGAGQVVTVHGPDDTIARMAEVVGVSPAEMREAGRERAAEVLEGLLKPIDANMARSAEEFIASLLNPDLARFTDAELLAEVQGRMLYMASRLQATGEAALEWTLDAEGLLEMVSRSTRKDGD
jgi:hypothetical protein